LIVVCSASAQTESRFRLQIGTQVKSSGLPILDHHGERVAMRTATGLVLLNRQGRTAAEITGKFLKYLSSPDGSSIAVMEKVTKEDREEEAALIIRWYDRQGRQYGSYNFLQHGDDPLPQFLFAANGSHLLMAKSATARLIFLNRAGQVLREHILFGEAPHALERPLFLAASNDVFVVLSQRAPSTTDKPVSPVLFCFSSSGEEQWRRELPLGTAGAVALFDEGQYIIASRYAVVRSSQAASESRVESTITLFDRKGEQRATIDGLFRQALFAKDGGRLLLMDRRQLRMISLPSGKLHWQINLSRKTEMLVDIAATAELDKIFALAGASVFKDNRFLFENNRLLGFNGQGKQQFATSVKQALSSPRVMISEDGQRLILAAEGLLQSFTISDLAK
jgi:hypothetical protein